MLLKTESVAPDEVNDLKLAYLSALCAPLDGMWEGGYVPLSQHWAILAKNRVAGYFCVDSDRALLQFYLPGSLAREAPAFLAGLISLGQVRSAFVGTNEPETLALCLDRQQSVVVHSLLYREDVAASLANEGSSGLRRTEFDDFEPMVRFIEKNIHSPGDWIRGYLRRLVDRGESYFWEEAGQILGAGECRASDHQPPYVDLGMIVDHRVRGRGMATAILKEMRKLCHGRGQRPICSTTADNLAARRAIEKAGFIAYHRILHIQF